MLTYITVKKRILKLKGSNVKKRDALMYIIYMNIFVIVIKF